MRRLMLLAAMLAMVLAAASPAFAQIDQSEDNDTVVNDASVNCAQILAQVGGAQYNEQLAGEDAASVQGQEFTAEQVQQCLAQAGEGNAAAQNVGDVNGDGVVDETDILLVVEGESGNGENGEDGNGEDGETLPDTGGASLLTLGAGALLVAGGLIARRIVR